MINIQHDKINQKFFAITDGKNSELNYRVLPDGKTLEYYRTFVPPELRGQHIGDDIVKHALQYAKENFYNVVPSCPFVKRIIERHPEYQSLVR